MSGNAYDNKIAAVITTNSTIQIADKTTTSSDAGSTSLIADITSRREHKCCKYNIVSMCGACVCVRM